MLISDKQTAIRIDLTLQGKPNHTTCGHSRSPTWQPFTSSRPGFPTCNTYSEVHPSSESSPARVVPDAPAGRLNSREGYSSYVSPGAYELCRFTEPITRHVTSTVQWLVQGTVSNGP